MSLADSAAARRLSKTVFGQEMRLAVMCAIADTDGVFTLTDLAQRLAVTSQSTIQRPLKDLEDAGLIQRMRSDSRYVHYRRNSSTAWAFAQELLHNSVRDAQDSRTDR